jgi:hypothetical protein
MFATTHKVVSFVKGCCVSCDGKVHEVQVGQSYCFIVDTVVLAQTVTRAQEPKATFFVEEEQLFK